MKKAIFFAIVLVIILAMPFVFASGGYKAGETLPVNISNDINSIDSPMSFGNQSEKLISSDADDFVKNEDRVYAISSSFADGDSIVTYNVNKPQKYEKIYKTTESGRLHQIDILNGWVYFLEGVGDHGNEEMQLKKIKFDGSAVESLISNIDSYILTKNKIYYQKTNWLNKTSIRTSDIYGKKRSKITDDYDAHTVHMIGLHQNYIYYVELDNTSDANSYYDIYRIKLNGTSRERIMNKQRYDDFTRVFNSFIPENNNCYYFCSEEDRSGVTHATLMKKDVNGKESVLATSSGGDKYTLNKEGNWLYFYENTNLYKVNINGRGKKKLIYDSEYNIQGILVFDGGIFISTNVGESYFKKNGAVIVLER